MAVGYHKHLWKLWLPSWSTLETQDFWNYFHTSLQLALKTRPFLETHLNHLNTEGCLRADQRTTLTWKISVSQFEEVLKFRWFCGMFPSWKRESVADRNVVSNNRIWWKPVLQTQSHSLLKIDSSWCISCCLCAIPLLAVKNKNIHNWFSSD